jgi:toxin ParE1/3/4
MRLVWLEDAQADLVDIYSHIAQNNPAAAARTIQRIVTLVNELLTRPQSGRPGRVSGTRELVITRTPYLVPYRVRAGTIEVLRVYHGAREWPEHFA